MDGYHQLREADGCQRNTGDAGAGFAFRGGVEGEELKLIKCRRLQKGVHFESRLVGVGRLVSPELRRP